MLGFIVDKFANAQYDPATFAVANLQRPLPYTS